MLALLGVALVAALAFAVLGGGSSTSSTPPAAIGSSGTTGATGAVAISQAPAANKAVSETTSGAHQHSGTPRNPFTPLPSAAAKPSSAGFDAGHVLLELLAGRLFELFLLGLVHRLRRFPGNEAGPQAGQAQAKPQKCLPGGCPLRGRASSVPPSQGIPVTPFNNLTRLYPLAVNGEAPLVFTGVTAGGASAIFTIVREVIPHGPAVCHPSASQCQAIQLKPGQSEELEYIPPSGQALVYRLQLVSITAVHASAAKAAAAFHSTSRAGRALLRGAGLSALPGLRYSTGTGE